MKMIKIRLTEGSRGEEEREGGREGEKQGEKGCGVRGREQASRTPQGSEGPEGTRAVPLSGAGAQRLCSKQ